MPPGAIEANAAASGNQITLETPTKAMPISIFASVSGYAQAEIIVGAPRAQHTRG